MHERSADMVAFREFEEVPYVVTICSPTAEAFSMFQETSRPVLATNNDDYPFAVYVDDLEITYALAKMASTNRLPFEPFTQVSKNEPELWLWSAYHLSAFGSRLVSSREVLDFGENILCHFGESRLLPYAEFPKGYLEIVCQLLSYRGGVGHDLVSYP